MKKNEIIGRNTGEIKKCALVSKRYEKKPA